MHKISGKYIPDVEDIFDGSLDPFLAKWKVSKLIELLEKLTTRQDELEAVLREIAEVEPAQLDGDYNGTQWYECVYCHGGESVSKHEITHADDCPWVRAKKLVDRLKT